MLSNDKGMQLILIKTKIGINETIKCNYIKCLKVRTIVLNQNLLKKQIKFISN